MSVHNNVNFTGKIPESEKRRINTTAVLGAPIVAAGMYAAPALLDKFQGKDTFKNSFVKRVEAHAESGKTMVSWLCEKVKKPNWAETVKNVKNTNIKVLAPLLFAETLLFAACLKLGGMMGLSLRHRND